MKAWVLERQAKVEEGPLRLVEVETPQPKADELRVKVLVCGLCRTDIHIAEGDLPLKRPNVILGHEVVGVVDEVGEGVRRFKVGDRVGISWLNSTCGRCKYCLSGRENYCPEFKATGWDADGGFAEYTIIREDFAFNLNEVDLEPEEIAPLMCPGLAGYGAFKLTGAQKGEKLGLYGFGPTAYYVLKTANYLGIDVYVSTRSPKHIEEARRGGAAWAGGTTEEMPCKLDRAIVFPPAGGLVELALSQLEVGGVLVLAPVSMTPIEIKDYSGHLWGRDIKTLYNVKKSWGEEFLRIASELGLTIGKQVFPFEELQEAMILAKAGRLEEPNAVIRISDQ